MPFVSVIVPIYNVERYLEKCVSSIINQDFRDFELILIDDGSLDNCGQMCDSYAKGDGRIKVVHKENGGQSDARNAGLEMARGEYLTFVDADDYVEPSYLSYLIRLMETNERPGISRSNHFIERGVKRTTNAPVKGETALFTRREALEAVLYHDRVDVSPWAGLFHRAIFESVRFPKGKLFEDTYIFSDIISRTDAYAYGDQPQYHYVQRSGSTVNQAFRPKNLEYIDAVKRLTDYAVKEYPSLEQACHRRMTHVYLSVLRYMERVEPQYKQLRDELREKALQYADEVCANPKAPRRDKLALKLLKLGYFPYYTAWNAYSVLRR